MSVETLKGWCISQEGIDNYDVDTFIDKYNEQLSIEQIEILNYIKSNQKILEYHKNPVEEDLNKYLNSVVKPGFVDTEIIKGGFGTTIIKRNGLILKIPHQITKNEFIKLEIINNLRLETINRQVDSEDTMNIPNILDINSTELTTYDNSLCKLFGDKFPGIECIINFDIDRVILVQKDYGLNLYTVLNKNILTFNQIFQIIFKLISTLVCLHSNNLLHLDLSMFNITIQVSSRSQCDFKTLPLNSHIRPGHDCKSFIIDYGSSLIVENVDVLSHGWFYENSLELKTTQKHIYFPPESKLSGKVNSKFDVWSAGIIINKILKHYEINGLPLDIDDNIIKEKLAELKNKMLEEDYENRLTSWEVYNELIKINNELYTEWSPITNLCLYGLRIEDYLHLLSKKNKKKKKKKKKSMCCLSRRDTSSRGSKKNKNKKKKKKSMCCLSRRDTSSRGSKKNKNKKLKNKREIKSKYNRKLSSNKYNKYNKYNKNVLVSKNIPKYVDFIPPIISKKKLQKRIKNQEKIISKLQNIDKKK